MTSTLTFDIFARDRASGTFNKFGDAVKGAGDDTTKAGGKVEGFGGKIGGLVGKLGIAGGAMAGLALAAKGIADAMDREVVNDRLAASLGATPKMAEKMGKVSSRLYAGAWGDSMGEVADAVEAVGTSFDGMGKGGQLERVSRQAMDFSKIFRVDLPKATMVAGQAVKSGLAKNATEAFDLMTAASQRVPAALRDDVLDAGNEYGQFFASLGFSGEQAFGMLAKGAEKGTYGIDKVGDAIKEFTIRSTDGSKASTDAYKAIGLNAEDMATKIIKGGKGAATATSDIVGGLLKMKDPAKQAQTAIALFGTPLEDLNVKDIPDFLRSMQKGTEGMDGFKGSIDRAGDTLNDNASTKIEAFKRSMQTAFVDFLGGKVLPAAEKFGGYLKDTFGPVIQKAGDWFRTELLPPLRDLAESAAPKARDIMTALKGAFQDAKPFIELMGKVLVNVVVPGLKKLVEIAGPTLVGNIKLIGKAFEFMGNAGKTMWNTVLQPVFKFIVNGVADILDGWASMLGAMGKVPGFGWAKKAAEAMGSAAEKARAVAAGIEKIKDKKVTVTVAYKYEGRKGGAGSTRGDSGGEFDPGSYLGRGRAGMTIQSATAKFFDALADGMKKGGKKLDAVLDASRTRLRDKLGGIRDEMKSMGESIASALNQVDFSGSLTEHLASLTGTNGALTNLMAVFEKLKSSVSKDYLSSLMQSGNIGLATALANDPAAAAQASALYDSNASIAKGLGDQTAQQVMGDKIVKALELEIAKMVRELKDSPGKTARELRKEIKEIKLVVEGLSAGQRAYLRGAS
jgi:phage-related minor tail protein